MAHVVIIGAGPMGLYLAYKLHKAGVRNIVIYDPRAGEYTRPGHINRDIFATLEQKLNESFWSGKRGHIKDIERILFERVIYLKIPIEKKKFVRFNDDGAHKGIILENGEEIQELVDCDYVFDCTGTRRALIYTVNSHISPNPFTIKPISTNINVKNHFIAYVKMSESDLEQINDSSDSLVSVFKKTDPLHYAGSMEKLRELGWKELGFPRCYGVEFTKGKVCLYLECPDTLSKESSELWVQSVILARTNNPNITFKQLPPSKKGVGKPRFNSFLVEPMELSPTAFQGPGLPTVVAIGDSQIDPNYYLAHGIRDGLQRVDQLIDHIEVYQGCIEYFDATEYQGTIRDQLSKHREMIIEHYKERSKYFHESLENARVFYANAIQLAYGTDAEAGFKTTFKEIVARINFHDAVLLMPPSLVITDTTDLGNMEIKLTRLRAHIIDALTDLPLSFVSERTSSLEMLKKTAVLFKDLGNQFSKRKSYNKALEMYAHALDIYQHPLLTNACHLEELVARSNSIITLRNLKNYDDAIEFAKQALDKYPDDPSLLPIKGKILLNFIKAVEEELERYKYTSSSSSTYLMLKSDAEEFISLHSDLLDLKIHKSSTLVFLKSPEHNDEEVNALPHKDSTQSPGTEDQVKDPSTHNYSNGFPAFFDHPKSIRRNQQGIFPIMPYF